MIVANIILLLLLYYMVNVWDTVHCGCLFFMVNKIDLHRRSLSEEWRLDFSPIVAKLKRSNHNKNKSSPLASASVVFIRPVSLRQELCELIRSVVKRVKRLLI